jgi:hypothetical protein
LFQFVRWVFQEAVSGFLRFSSSSPDAGKIQFIEFKFVVALSPRWSVAACRSGGEEAFLSAVPVTP